jgi:hypothetical protein
MVSADDTAYLLPAMDPRIRAPSAEQPRPEPAAVAEPSPDPNPSMRSDFLRRVARILAIIGILTLVLYLITRNWD